MRKTKIKLTQNDIGRTVISRWCSDWPPNCHDRINTEIVYLPGIITHMDEEDKAGIRLTALILSEGKWAEECLGFDQVVSVGGFIPATVFCDKSCCIPKFVNKPKIHLACFPGDTEKHEVSETTKIEDGVPYHRHPNGGGWVADTATVTDSAFVGLNACVRDKARVLDNVRVYGNSWVYGEAYSLCFWRSSCTW